LPIPPANIIAKYLMDENGTGINYVDSVGGYDLQLILPASTTADFSIAGKIGRAMKSPNNFLADTTYKNFAGGVASPFICNAFTLFGYFNCDGTAGAFDPYHRIVDHYYMFGGTTYQIIFQVDLDITGNRLYFRVGHNGSPDSIVMSVDRGVGFYFDSVWRQFCCSFIKQAGTPRMKLWINGVNESTGETSYNDDVINPLASDKIFNICNNQIGLGCDNIMFLNDVFVPTDFVNGNELLNHAEIWPNIYGV
jgi:hypothetical protein